MNPLVCQRLIVVMEVRMRSSEVPFVCSDDSMAGLATGARR